MATFCLMFAVSCSTTTLNTVWKDDNYQGGKLKEIIIIGVARNQTIRRLFEDEFAKRLKDRGLEAFASYTVIPSEGMLDKVTVESKIKNLEVGAVLVTRLLESKKERAYAIPARTYRRGWYDYYYRSYEYNRQLNNYYEYEVVNLETNIYETQAGNLIWSGLSETFVQGTDQEEIRSFIEVIMKSLSDNQLI
jgi:hypothetical protein